MTVIAAEPEAHKLYSCYMCKLRKPRELFSPDKSRRLKIMSRCKACQNHATTERQRKKYQSDPAYRELKNSQSRKHYADLSIRHQFKARAATRYAIQSGKLIRPKTCENCAILCKPNAHHPDYSKPLSVMWLCLFCHRKIH